MNLNGKNWNSLKKLGGVCLSVVVVGMATPVAAALLNLSQQNYGYPEIGFVNSTLGAVSYSSSGDLFAEFATPGLLMTVGANGGFVNSFILPTQDPNNPTGPKLRTMTIRIQVDDHGQLIGDPASDNLVIYGQVDVNNDRTVDAYGGPLLTGEIVDFGYQDGGSGNPNDLYDFRFKITGGTLVTYGLYTPGHDDLYVKMTSEGGTFSGQFSTDFQGFAKGTVYTTPTPGAIANKVWLDRNGNGIQDQGEPGLAGVTLNLNDANGVSVGSTVTDSDGNYSFNKLVPGSYTVQVGVTVGPTTYLVSQKNAPGSLVGNDSDLDAITGKLPPIILHAGEVVSHLDAGLYLPVTVGDKAWVDSDGDGLQSGNEVGLANVAVALYRFGDLTTVLATTSTDGSGNYLFTGLQPGSYTTVFSPPVGYMATGLPPSGNPDCASLSSGEENLTLDAGFYLPATISNKVWHDLNGNGIQDADEPGVAGVAVSLYDAAGLLVGNTSTDTDGKYAFANLPPGQYVVQVGSAPYRISPLLAPGSDPGTDSDLLATGNLSLITLHSGEAVSQLDAGLYLPVTLSGKVWSDVNGNGVQENGENGLDAILVTLIDGGGQVLSTTTTANGGSYSFANLNPGTYAVLFAKGINFFTLAKVGGNDTLDSDANPTTGQTDAYLLSSGASKANIDAGLILVKPTVAIITSTNGEDADLATGPTVVVGKTVTWSYLVTNTGSVPLTNAVVTDDRLAETVCTIPMLAVGGSQSCTYQGTAVRGQYVNFGRVTAQGNGGTATATNPSHYLGVQPAIDIQKLVSTNGGGWVDANTEAEALEVPACADVVAASGNECSGSVTELSFAYLGQEKVDIEVRDKGEKILYHLEEVKPGQEFTLAPPKDSKGRLLPLPSDIRLYTKCKKSSAKNKEWQYHATIHSNCTEPIGPGQESGDFEVVEGKSSLGGELCKVKKNSHGDDRKPCSAKASSLSFIYHGSSSKQVKITDDEERILFEGHVKPGAKFRVHGQDRDGALTTALKISCDGRLHTTVKTDCSVAIGPGKRNGDFEIEDGESLEGGKLCGVDSENNYISEEGGVAYEQPTCTASKVSFKFVVTNSGDVPLTNLVVQDNGSLLAHCTPPATLEKTASFTCIAGPTPAVAGAMQVDTGSVTGSYAGQLYSDSDKAYYYVPESADALTVVKTAFPETVAVPCGEAGNTSNQSEDAARSSSDDALATCLPSEVVTYTYLVANRGGAMVDVRVVDDHLGLIATFATLEAGGSRTVTKQACISVTTVNTVTVTGTLVATHQVLQAQGEATVEAVCTDGGDPECRDGLIGDFVWNDLNRNGIQDEGESGLAGATVTLSGTNVYGVAVNPPSVVTAANGGYQFAGLCQGSYKVTVTPPVGYTAAPWNQGSDRAKDSNDSPASVLLANDHSPEKGIDFGYYLTATVLGAGDTATIGFWQNKNGQALILALNGGASAKNLGNWLATSFPYLFGANAGSNNLTGKSNTEVAALFVRLLAVRGQNTDAQIMGGALACYVTNSTLAGSTAARYGFNLSATGTAVKSYNVGGSGTALGLKNNTVYSVMALLQQVNLQKKNGTFNANAANVVFDGINQLGDIR